ncbi:MAG: outer membrane beta-barrel protein [Bacteroidota bacterium]
MLSRALLILFLFSLSPFLSAQSSWHWGAQKQAGFSGWRNTGEQSGLSSIPGIRFHFSSTESLQHTFGGGAWAALEFHARWRLHLGLSYRWTRSRVDANYNEIGGRFIGSQIIQNGWRSQYFQLPLQLQYAWGKSESVQPYLGLGLQLTYLWKYQHQHRVTWFPTNQNGVQERSLISFDEEIPLADSDDLEQTRLKLGLTGEVGLRINQFTLAIGTTQFFQHEKEEFPSYPRNLDFIDNGDDTYTPIGTPLRYMGSVEVRFYYSIR